MSDKSHEEDEEQSSIDSEELAEAAIDFIEQEIGYPEFFAGMSVAVPTMHATSSFGKIPNLTKGINNLTIDTCFSDELNQKAIETWEEGDFSINPDEEERKQHAEALREEVVKHLSTRKGRISRLSKLLESLRYQDDLGEIVYDYVDHALDNLENVNEADKTGAFRDKIGRKLIEQSLPRLFEILDKYDEQLGSHELEVDGMFWRDAVAIEWLQAEGYYKYKPDRTPEDTKEDAREAFNNDPPAKQLLAMWLDPEKDIPWKIMPVQWVCEVIAKRENRLRDNHAALAQPVFDVTTNFAWGDNRTVEKQENQLILFDDDECLAETGRLPTSPTMTEERLQTVIREGTEELKSTTGIQLIVHAIRRGFKQKFGTNMRNPSFLRYPGGFGALAEELKGKNNNNIQADLKNILKAGQSWDIDWPTGEASGLWTYHYDEATGKDSRAHLEIRLGAPLMPQYVQTLQGSDRILVPIVKLMPPFGSPRYYANVSIFQLSLVRNIVERRLQVAQRGGAKLSLREITKIAKQAGLPPKTAKDAIDRWKQDGDDAPAFLEEVHENHYHLADNERYGKAREFITKTARRSQSQSLRGKKSAENKKDS